MRSITEIEVFSVRPKEKATRWKGSDSYMIKLFCKEVIGKKKYTPKAKAPNVGATTNVNCVQRSVKNIKSFEQDSCNQ